MVSPFLRALSLHLKRKDKTFMCGNNIIACDARDLNKAEIKVFFLHLTIPSYLNLGAIINCHLQQKTELQN